MTLNLPKWFVDKYNDEFELRAQQRTRRLAGAVAGGGSFIGDQVYFPRAGYAEVYDSPRMAQLQLANSNLDWISFRCAPKFVAFGIWDPDKPKLSVSAASAYAEMAASATFRAEDNVIVNALNAAAVNGVQGVDSHGNPIGAAEQITTIGDYNTVADMDLISTGIAQLGTAEMFEGQSIVFVQPFKLKVQTSLDPYNVFSTAKDVPWELLDTRTFERLYDNNGTPISKASLLSGASTGVDMYLFAKSAVVSDYNNEPTKIEERMGGSLTDMLGQWFQAGGGVREPSGVIRIKSKLNFNIARKAMTFLAA